ncbi:MAG: flavodoxin family protein [Proteobacteria bacterium]|nr:flavodoxin family protein [Pseudomonadota bacterium]MBU1715230.1 flavodoxin family protein [Pseudomonadota bacterium]
MDFLALLGSPRKRGNSEILMDAVLDGVKMAGGKVEVVRLCDLDIHGCLGCGGCDKTGKCVVDDDMTLLYDKIISAQRIILASPVYFYGITAQAKAFVDRTQALWSRQRVPGINEAWFKDPDRKGFLLSVAATKGERVFEGLILTMKYGFDAMGLEYGGDFLVKGVDLRGDMKKQPDKLRQAELFGSKCVA